MKTARKRTNGQQAPTTVTLYPVRPLGPQRHGYSFTVLFRKIERPEIDPAEYDLPADQRTAIVEERDMRRSDAGADIVIDGPAGAWEGTTLEDPLTDDDKAILIRAGLAAWRQPSGLRCRSGAGRFTVDRKALRGYLQNVCMLPAEQVSSIAWSQIMATIRRTEGEPGHTVSPDKTGNVGNVAGMPQADARRKAEQYVRDHGYPGTRKLSRCIGCSAATLYKVVAKSPALQEAKRRYGSKPRTSPRTVGLSEAIEATFASDTENDPADEASVREWMKEPRAVLLKEVADRLQGFCTGESDLARLDTRSDEELARLLVHLEDQAADMETDSRRRKA